MLQTQFPGTHYFKKAKRWKRGRAFADLKKLEHKNRPRTLTQEQMAHALKLVLMRRKAQQWIRKTTWVLVVGAVVAAVWGFLS